MGTEAISSGQLPQLLCIGVSSLTPPTTEPLPCADLLCKKCMYGFIYISLRLIRYEQDIYVPCILHNPVSAMLVVPGAA